MNKSKIKTGCYSCVERQRFISVQIVSESMGEAFVRLRLKDQAKSLAMIGEDPHLNDLRQIRAPLVDYEVRGLPALTYFGGMIWRDAIDAYAEGELINENVVKYSKGHVPDYACALTPILGANISAHGVACCMQ